MAIKDIDNNWHCLGSHLDSIDQHFEGNFAMNCTLFCFCCYCVVKKSMTVEVGELLCQLWAVEQQVPQMFCFTCIITFFSVFWTLLVIICILEPVFWWFSSFGCVCCTLAEFIASTYCIFYVSKTSRLKMPISKNRQELLVLPLPCS